MMRISRSQSYSAEYLQHLDSTCAPSYLDSLQEGQVSHESREELARWVFLMSDSLSATSRTSQLTIVYIDEILSKKRIRCRNALVILGYVCISLALKYEEGRALSPVDIQRLSENRFSVSEYVIMETFVFKTLGWSLERPTASDVSLHMLQEAFESAEFSNIALLTQPYLQMAYKDYEVCRSGPLLIAVCAVRLALESRNLTELSNRWLLYVQQMYSVDTRHFEHLCERLISRVG